MALTTEDQAFLYDDDNWGSGPELKLIWTPLNQTDGLRLAEELADDIWVEAIVEEFAIEPDRENFFSGDILWSPGRLAPVGISYGIGYYKDGSMYASIPSDHTERATGYEYFSHKVANDRHVHEFYAALIALTNRLHAKVGLKHAAIFDEGNMQDAHTKGMILLDGFIPEGANGHTGRRMTRFDMRLRKCPWVLT